MELTANLVPLARLVGTWAGEGAGEYPTIAPFTYHEEITFAFVGKPFLVYTQRTRAADGSPLHMETGYLRHTGDGHLEFVLALPTGQVELAEGALRTTEDGLTVELDAQVWATSTAKDVSATRRTYRINGDVLETVLDMAAVGRPMARHLESHLVRTA
ncbi:FABP family protein [Raineyella sp. LH-20]|uniref:FABP family protein n=1 Tax=Raineyella sp. LH-20 TaxID=3081204 RepID=UPI002955703C|nr:FABP family protein [Raineyella sp. LH-20]WOP17451.1 FABP family protein [Raineyella sp. LH-20]